MEEDAGAEEDAEAVSVADELWLVVDELFMLLSFLASITKYPIGTVAKIDHKGKHFYFVAINDVNEYGKPIGKSIENVGIALTAVADAI